MQQAAFDPQAATDAYLATLDPAMLEKARAFTLGNHWLILGGLVVSALVTWIIVRSGILDKVAARLEQRAWALRTFLVAIVFLIASTLISLPYSLYTEWWRLKQYGLSAQPLGDFLGQAAISTVISALLGGLFFLGVYALIRKAGRLWWVWGGAFCALAIAFILIVSPLFIQPIFNKFEPIPEGEVRDAVVAMAEEVGIPEDKVFVYDGSRQSENFTANVSGIGPAKRIAISDVALGEASLDEVKAVTGHEIGHYVLGHSWRAIIVYGVLGLVGLFLVGRFYPWFARKFGTDAALDDPRGLPVFTFVFGLAAILAGPATNALTRSGETQADAFSLEMVGLPDAMAGALLKTAEYRYPKAGPVEEFLFYTHPTVERRIRMSMDWKAANFDSGAAATE